MDAFPALPTDLAGLRKLDDLQRRYGHTVILAPIPGETQVWRAELIHRDGLPVVQLESSRLAPAVAVLLSAAEALDFWAEPPEREKGL